MPSKGFVIGCVVSVARAVGFACLQRASFKTALRAGPRSAPLQLGGGNVGKAHVAAAYGNLPLAFEPNQGQAPGGVQYLARGANFTAYLTRSEAILALPTPRTMHSGLRGPSQSARVHLRLRGAKIAPELLPAEPLVGKVNYLAGKDSAKWHRNIPTFGKVEYQNIYPGIDVAYYGRQNRLEYDFAVAPGADPNEIRMDLTGVTSMKLDSSGDLHLQSPSGELIQNKPVIYQANNPQRHEIRGGYRLLANNEMAFNVGPYDHTKPLVIDPAFSYAASIEPSPMPFELTVNAVAVDSQGNAYATGFTTTNPSVSGEPPDEGCIFEAEAGLVNSFDECGAAFVTKLDPTGTTVLYNTLIAGAQGNAIVAASNGDVYITGITGSDLPATASAFQQNIGPGDCSAGESSHLGCTDAFVLALDSTGSNIPYASFLGGTGNDIGQGIAVDLSNTIYVTGGAASNDFPTTPGAFQTTFTSGQDINAIFVAKIDATKSGAASLVYSTFLGGSSPGTGSVEGTGSPYDVGGDHGNGIAVDSDGNAYVAGVAFSGNIATSAPYSYQRTRPEPQSPFVAKFDPNGSTLVWASYLGGSHAGTCSDEYAAAIAVDTSGSAYVTGQATSVDFPSSTGGLPLTTTSDVFATKFDEIGDSFLYSKVFGGSTFPASVASPPCPAQGGTAIAVDTNGNAFVAGQTQTIDFPISGLTLLGSSNFNGTQARGFVVELDRNLDYLFSTYLPVFSVTGLAVDNTGGVYTSVNGAAPLPGVPGASATSGDGVKKIDLNAQGPGLILAPQTMAFATNSDLTTPGQEGALESFGNGPIQLSSIVKNLGPGLTESDSCQPTMPTGTGCTFTVFGNAPTAGTSTITFNDNAVDSPQVLTIYVYSPGDPGMGNLSATNLFFPPQDFNTASPLQIVTLASQGTAPLLIQSIHATGDFVESDNCGSSMIIGGACQIRVYLVPEHFGGLTGSVVIQDNDPRFPTRTISLAGTGNPIRLTIHPSSSSLSISPGDTATFSLQVIGPLGYSGSFSVSCSGAPSDAKCTAPTPLNLSSPNGTTETITVSTTAASSVSRDPRGPGLPRAPLFAILMLCALAGAMFLFLSASDGRRREFVLCAFVLLGCALAASCGGSGGGGNGGGGGGGGGNGGTPTGTYTLHVTFTGGGGTTDLPLKLIVQ